MGEMKYVWRRVAQALSDEHHRGFGEKYLDLILETWREIDALFRRMVLFIVLLVIGFALLVGVRSTRFSLGPVQLTDASAALALIPPIVSVLWYQAVVLFFASWRYEKLTEVLAGELFPSFLTSQLHYMIGPASPRIWGSDDWRLLQGNPSRRSQSETRFDVVSQLLNLPLMLAIVLGPLVFVVHEVHPRP